MQCQEYIINQINAAIELFTNKTDSHYIADHIRSILNP
jgi:hypothetical protein